MHGIIYLVGLIVVVLAILSFFGFANRPRDGKERHYGTDI